MRDATRVVLALLAAALVVLASTGIWLWFRYEPTAAAAWPGLGRASHGQSWIRVAHRVSAFVAVVLALTALVLLLVRRVRTGARGVVAGVAVLVTALAASFTGYLLPWDQLALWAVTVGSDLSGAQATFRNEVKFIIVGSREVSPGTYRFWAIAHVALGVLVAVTVVLAWLRTRRRSVSPPRRPARVPAPAPASAPEPAD